jgi:predicted nucleic-acid-binding protein
MKRVDANIVPRYLLDDPAELSPQTKNLIDQNIVEVSIEVLCEVVYVLTGHYGVDRLSVSTELKRFFEQTNCTLPHRETVLRGIVYFGEQSLDFVDCLLASYAEVEADDIITFDNKLQKLIVMRRVHTPPFRAL